MTPGRSCPLHYRYAPADISRGRLLSTRCLYIVGGLYGNLPALDAIEALAAQEPQPPSIVFNGDFNWFNIDAAGFGEINRRVLQHTALRGNVETEIAGDDAAAGCGCAYPDFVGDADVERSNRILEQLRNTARACPEIRRRLGGLPMHALAEVGGTRIAIVHGDCESLAGWGLSHEALQRPQPRARAARWFAQIPARVIASSHSCLPVAARFDTPQGVCALFNNGAAGMPNFLDTHYGVITRIATQRAAPGSTLYSARIDEAWVEAIPVRYQHQRWLDNFLANWGEGTAAHTSYFRRITQGAAFHIEDAARLAASESTDWRPTAVAAGRT